MAHRPTTVPKLLQKLEKTYRMLLMESSRNELTDDDTHFLRRCLALSKSAMSKGNPPVGSVLIDGAGRELKVAENTTVSLRDPFGHPELTLAKWAINNLDLKTRQSCVLYSSLEFCPMCFGAAFYADVPRLVFAFSNDQITAIRGEAVPAIRLSSQQLAKRAIARPIKVLGPDPNLAIVSEEIQTAYWLRTSN